MVGFLLVLQVVLAVIIAIVVLLQKSSSIGLGVYSGSNEGVFGAKGNAGFLSRTTMVLGLIFVINTIALGYLYNRDYEKSVVDSVSVESAAPENAAPTESVPAAPESNAVPAAPAAPDAIPAAPSAPLAK